MCGIRDDYSESFSRERLDKVAWDEQSLKTETTREHQLKGTLWRFIRAHRAMMSNFYCTAIDLNREDMQAASDFRRQNTEFASHAVESLTDAIVPLAFEEMGGRIPEERLSKWIRGMEKLQETLRISLGTLAERMTGIAHHKMRDLCSGAGPSPLPLALRTSLLVGQTYGLPLRDDVTKRCESLLPEVDEMVELTETVYTFGIVGWFTVQSLGYSDISKDQDFNQNEEWQLEDQSNNVVAVDTSCVQLLVGLVDDPPCPLEEVSYKTILSHQHCRLQLRNNLARRTPYIPVTSYLAYTQRVSISLCLLSWMIATPESICQNVPFLPQKSLNQSRCFFSDPHGNSSNEEDTTETICSIARTLLTLKCKNVTQPANINACYENYTNPVFYKRARGSLSPSTKSIYNHRALLNNATLRYKDFKIDYLKPLEISFALVNITFRFLTVLLYMYLPQLRNLPGKIFLCYQLTGLVQILVSELVYRLGCVPDIATTVQLDSSLTLLGCVWLNLFCYRMFKCVHELSLPDELSPTEVKETFCRNALCALVAWLTVTSVVVTLEHVSEEYLFHSRVFVLSAISASVATNLVLLGAIGYMWRQTQSSMKRLNIVSDTKCSSMKQRIFMSLKTILLSGVGIILRLGFHQAEGIAQAVYAVHLATMLQGPLLFVLFVCSDRVLPLLRDHVQAWWDPAVVGLGQELGSAAERNLARRRGRNVPQVSETTL